jgi:hypothetical protein
MPRLISIDTSKEKEVKHEYCGAVIGYREDEPKLVLTLSRKGAEHNTLTYYIVCPNCGKDVTVDKN